ANEERIRLKLNCNLSNRTALLSLDRWRFGRSLENWSPANLPGAFCLRLSLLCFSWVGFSYAAGPGTRQGTCVFSTISSTAFTGAARRWQKAVDYHPTKLLIHGLHSAAAILRYMTE